MSKRKNLRRTVEDILLPLVASGSFRGAVDDVVAAVRPKRRKVAENWADLLCVAKDIAEEKGLEVMPVSTFLKNYLTNEENAVQMRYGLCVFSKALKQAKIAEFYNLGVRPYKKKTYENEIDGTQGWEIVYTREDTSLMIAVHGGHIKQLQSIVSSQTHAAEVQL